ncbi:hypothetical protein TNCV_4429611 [Trichonephila clavipes]|nr:hypothetical protein TNCV_4429611 [Trichonephila clavipes]
MDLVVFIRSHVTRTTPEGLAFSKLLHNVNWRTLSCVRYKGHHVPLYAGNLVTPGFESMTHPLWPRVRDYGHSAIVAAANNLRDLVAALWDKKVIIQDPREEEILGFCGRTATQGEKDIFGSRAAIEFGFEEGERLAQRRSN